MKQVESGALVEVAYTLRAQGPEGEELETCTEENPFVFQVGQDEALEAFEASEALEALEALEGFEASEAVGALETLEAFEASGKQAFEAFKAYEASGEGAAQGV